MLIVLFLFKVKLCDFTFALCTKHHHLLL